MCVWPCFLAPTSSNTSSFASKTCTGSSSNNNKNRPSLDHLPYSRREAEDHRVHAFRFRCMPEKMADSRFQAAPQAMNLAAAAASAAGNHPPADMPDLSHLTEEERRIIESVMMRQRQEEERENEIMR
ncbi:hypothetical protein B566_EDAN014227 [Ephemera danica]|nr:hypothetical protein B566_EDAN014227 [Ephemera danica]